MEKNNIFWEKLFENKKVQILFFLFSMSVIITGYAVIVKPINRKVVQEKVCALELQEDYILLSNIEEVIIDSKNMILTGWALRKDSVNTEIFVSLQEVSGSEEIVLSTKMVEREKLEKNIYGNWDFGEIGFEAIVEKNEVKNDICYKILVVLFYEAEEWYKNEVIIQEREKKVFTSYYLYNGEIYSYNPIEFIEPNVADEALTNVINYGEICAYNYELGMWIYYYNNALYWIVNNSFKFSNTSLTHIPIHYRSYVDDKLWTREMQQDGFENRDIRFEKYELAINDENYRVAKQDVPFEYPISYIVTGVFDDETKMWVWKTKLNMLNSVGE